MDDALWNLSLTAGIPHKLEAAEYFEAYGDMKRAIALYNRGGT